MYAWDKSGCRMQGSGSEDDIEQLAYEGELPHMWGELMCIRCMNRYIGVWCAETPLKKLHCETCGPGFIIDTGQVFDEDDDT